MRSFPPPELTPSASLRDTHPQAAQDARVGRTRTEGKAAVRLLPFVRSPTLCLDSPSGQAAFRCPRRQGVRNEPGPNRGQLMAGHGKGEGTVGNPDPRPVRCGRGKTRSTCRQDSGAARKRETRCRASTQRFHAPEPKLGSIESLANELRRRTVKPPLVPRRRVLVVDDNLDYVRSLTLLLRSMGHQADFAINATAAISAARRFRPDTVLLDVGLPDGDGRLLAGSLRREAGLSNARIVCVTGRVHEDPRRSMEAGCDGHFVKPLDPALIENLLAPDR
jgi:CheY-like chemotaxis protein